MAFSSACGHKKSSSEELPFFIGADDEIRTRDIHLGKVVLYQLSYVRIVGVHFLAAFGISSRSNE